MKNFFNKLLMCLELLIGLVLIIWGITAVMPSFTGNVIIFIIGFFLLLDGLGRYDKLNGYGQQPPHDKHNKPPHDVNHDDEN